MTRHLFVYGSLMTAAGHGMGARLQREAALLGPALLAGRMFAVSWYPGVVDCSETGAVIHGELYALRDPAHSFAWLDAYEGIEPGLGRESEFARVLRSAALPDDQAIKAWVYLYQGPTDGLRAIPGGCWSSRPASFP